MRMLLPFLFALVLATSAPAEDAGRVVKSLTLRECVERALAGNLDIQIERINPGIEKWGVVGQQGTFDPRLTATADYEDSKEPTDTGSFRSKQLGLSGGLAGKLPTGAEYGLTAFDNRSSSTLTTNFLYTGTAALSLSQPLLKNFGFSANTALIRVARASKKIAVQNFIRRVMDTVAGVNNTYYELVFAIEDHKAKLEDLNRAKQLLAENRRRVEVGVMSPLDVTQAEAGVAEREEAVIVAERRIKDNENALKRLITGDVAEFRGMDLLPADYPLVQMIEIDPERSIGTALASRPDFIAAKHELERRRILVRYNRNQAWPEIDLQASYGYNGRSVTGFDDFTDNLGSGDYPAWSVGMTFSFPLGNRQARATYQTARLQADQALLSLKRLEQDIIVQADNAVGQVRTNLKRVDATRAASRLAEESLKAEETKLRAGASTSFLVLQAQSLLAAARSAEIRARADYDESLVALANAEGSILRQHNITLKEDF